MATVGVLHATAWGLDGNGVGYGVGGGVIVRATGHVDTKFEVKGCNFVPLHGGVGSWYPVATVGIGYRL